jgi:hypothetical protein
MRITLGLTKIWAPAMGLPLLSVVVTSSVALGSARRLMAVRGAAASAEEGGGDSAGDEEIDGAGNAEGGAGDVHFGNEVRPGGFCGVPEAAKAPI